VDLDGVPPELIDEVGKPMRVLRFARNDKGVRFAVDAGANTVFALLVEVFEQGLPVCGEELE